MILAFFFPSEFSHAKIPVGSSAFFMKANKKVVKLIEEGSGAKCSIDSAASLMNMCGEDEAISKAKDLLDEQIAQYGKENASIILDRNMVSSVIGKKGATINKIQKDTGAQIKVDSAGGLCRITGDEEAVQACLEIIAAMKDKWQKENKVKKVEMCVKKENNVFVVVAKSCNTTEKQISREILCSVLPFDSLCVV